VARPSRLGVGDHDELFGDVPVKRKTAGGVLVPERAVDDGELFTGEQFPQGLRQRPDAVGIVAAVDEQAFLDLVQPRRPAHTLEACQRPAEVEMKFLCEVLQHVEDDAEIFSLHTSRNAQYDLFAAPEKCLGEAAGGLPAIETGRYVVSRSGHSRAELAGAGADDLFRFGNEFAVKEGNARFEDPRLFARDRGKGAAEMFLMVQRDIGDDRHGGHNGIGGVQTAPHARFPDDDVAVLLLEKHGGEDGGEFEIGRRQSLALFREFPHGVVETLFADGASVDAEALFYVDQVGRRIKSRPESGAAQGALQHGPRGTLAVGARDVDEAQLLLRIPRRGKKSFHIVQSQTDAEHIEVRNIGVAVETGPGKGFHDVRA